MQSSNDQILVVGAGVIGLSVALAVQARGLPVRVIERAGPAAGASAGNAGAFAFSDILPLAAPRILRQAPFWLADPLGPLSIPPAYAVKIAPWLWRFWKASFPAQVAASTQALIALMRHSQATLAPFLAREGVSHMVRRKGQLQLYEGAREYRASLPGWRLRAENGIAFEPVEGAAIAEIQPGIAARFTHGVWTPDWHSVTDPRAYTLALAAQFQARGGVLVQQEALALRPDGVLTAAGAETGRVVLAAGAWSHHLARGLGLRIPLETERGYNTTLPADAFDLRTQLTFSAWICCFRAGQRGACGGRGRVGGAGFAPQHAPRRCHVAKSARLFAGAALRGGRAMDGLSPLAARQPACHWPCARPSGGDLRLWPWSSGLDPIHRNGGNCGRSAYRPSPRA